MKKRIIKTVILIFCLFLIPQTAVFAQEKESLEQFAGTDELWEQIPSELDEADLRTLLDGNQSGGFLKTILDKILSLFSLGITSGIEFFSKIGALLLLSALFRALKDSFSLKGLENAFDFLFFICLSLTAYGALQDCINLATSSIEAIETFFIASLPITTVLLTLAGSPTAAGTMASSLSFMIAAASTLVSTLLTPLLNTLFAFSVCDGIMDGKFKSLLAFTQKTLKILCVIFFTLITAALAIQNALSAATDSVAMRSVRFAAGNFIPIVGSLVGESSKILAASFSSVKAECGVLCIVVLAYVLLRPIICIAVQKMFLSFAESFADVIDEKGAKSFFKSFSALLDLLMALMISQGCYLIFYITLFITNRGGL